MSSARDYLFSLEWIGIKLGLEQIRALVEALGRPDQSYPSIIVAGTNGKGSVTAMTERALRAAGYRTGRYTSPHLIDIEERFVVDGRPIDPASFESAAERVRRAADSLPDPPSFFEATTALALDEFRRQGIDIAILEVGLGGRLDATNVAQPIAAAITSIDFDHEQYLGHTIEAIAGEKAGVIKPGMRVVLAKNPPEVRRVIEGACGEVNASLEYAPDGTRCDARLAAGRTTLSLATPSGRYDDVTLALRGRHQIDNAVTAVRLLEALNHSGRLAIGEAAIRVGLTEAVWPARLELLRWRNRDVLMDGAHNPAGARALAAYISETFGRRLPIVAGMMRDKRVDEMIEAFAAVASHFVFTGVHGERAAAPDDLATAARRLVPSIPIHVSAVPREALELAQNLGEPAVVAGSLYLCGEIRRQIS